MTYFIKADCFLLEGGEIADTYLEVENGRFGTFVREPPAGAVVRDYTGYIVAPGLFDTHIHGISGHDIMDGTSEAVIEISRALLTIGVTRFLPTTLTASRADLDKAIIAVKEAERQGLPGAVSEGIFLEGPYFTKEHKGAQNPGFFRDPSMEEFQHWQDLAEGTIVKIALAPERNGAADFIRKISQDGVLASLAHTNADYHTCKKAVEAGAGCFVHLFNGMKGLHHRDPGVVGTALTEPHTYAELICDGFHVHPAAATLVYRVKGDKLVLITDCMRAGLMPDGNYTLGEYPVIVKDGMAKTETGSLAGSILKLIDGVKNLHFWSNEPLHRIWHRGSLSPAASLGKDHELGSIKQGKKADYVVFNEHFQVEAAAVDGEIKYEKRPES